MNQTQFFTPVNLASLASATAMVVVAAIALKKVAGLKPSLTAFLFSQVLALLNVLVNPNWNWVDWALLFFNGCLLYCTALGLNETLVQAEKKQRKRGAGVLPEKQRPTKLESWLPTFRV